MSLGEKYKRYRRDKGQKGEKPYDENLVDHHTEFGVRNCRGARANLARLPKRTNWAKSVLFQRTGQLSGANDWHGDAGAES